MAKRHMLDTTPPEDLQWSMGLINFDLGRALAEFIDNSIDGRSSSHQLEVNIQIEKGIIHILDNGAGMNLVQLTKALTPGRPKDSDGTLGKYGFGLKTAASYLGRHYEILTATARAKQALLVVADQDGQYNDDTRPTGNWQPTAVEIDIPQGMARGTRITISRLRHTPDPDRIERAKDHLSKVFKWYLETGILRLRINQDVIQPFSFDVVDQPFRWEIATTVVCDDGVTRPVHGWIGIMRPNDSLAKPSETDAGLYLAWNKRIIDYQRWVGLEWHPEVRLMTGELHLDGFTLSVNKTSFFQDSREWQELEATLARFIKDNDIRRLITVESARLSRERGTKKSSARRKNNATPPQAAPPRSPAKDGSHGLSTGNETTLPSGLNATLTRTPASPSQPPVTASGAKGDTNQLNSDTRPTRVFVVHGRDHAALVDLEALLYRLGLKPDVLKYKPNIGRTLIQKFQEESKGVSYVFVLATADDLGRFKQADEEQARARQNVIFELGFFAGKLGFGKVCLLMEHGVELPSDLVGITYVALAGAISGTSTELEIRTELEAAKILPK